MLERCTSTTQLFLFGILIGFRVEMINALRVIQKSASGGMFINSCYAHCQTGMLDTWLVDDSTRLNGKVGSISI